MNLAALRSMPLMLAAMCLAAAQQAPADRDRYADQARQALADKRWKDAAKALELLARLAPESPEVQANLGMAYYFEGRAEEAAAAFGRALKLNPRIAQAGTMLGLCYAELGRGQEAVRILAPVFRKPPDDGIGRLAGLSLQRAYSELRQFAQADAAGEELLRRYPGDPEILFTVSRLHAERSYGLMSRLMRDAPDSAWAHMAKAQVQDSLERYDAAQREYRAALAANPRLPGAHYHLGRVMLLSDTGPASLDGAMREFERELAIDPRNAEAEYETGEIFRERGDLEAAERHFARAVSYRPDFAQARIGLARTLLKKGRAKEALISLNEATRLEPGNKIPHYLLATAYKLLGDTSRVQRELELYRQFSRMPVPARPQAPVALSTPGANDLK